MMNSTGPEASNKCHAPFNLTNGTSKVSAGKKERQRLAAAIEFTGRKPQRTDSILSNGYVDSKPSDLSTIGEPARDPRDQATLPKTSSQNRPASPYTLNPPVDFDGLSWPSR